jgi:hypothetical protein
MNNGDLFDVVIEVRNAQGNLVFVYYPKASTIEVKRNQIYSHISLATLLEQGVHAIKSQSEGEPVRISLPELKPRTS